MIIDLRQCVKNVDIRRGYQIFNDNKIKKFNSHDFGCEGFLIGYYGYMNVYRNFIDSDRVGIHFDSYPERTSYIEYNL